MPPDGSCCARCALCAADDVVISRSPGKGEGEDKPGKGEDKPGKGEGKKKGKRPGL